MTAALADKLVGVWNLADSQIETRSGDLRPWADDAQGMLIYTRGGAMSVGILTANSTTARSKIFYAGRFNVAAEGVIEHIVEISAEPHLSGMTIRRAARLDGDTLMLTTHWENDERAHLTWVRRE